MAVEWRLFSNRDAPRMANAKAATRNRWGGAQAGWPHRTWFAGHRREDENAPKLPASSEMSPAESTETLKPRGRSWHRIPWFGGLFIAAIVALAVWDVVRGYRAAADDTDRELETQARVIAEQTARSVQAVDVVLRHVAAEYKRGRLARLSPDELHQLPARAIGRLEADRRLRPVRRERQRGRAVVGAVGHDDAQHRRPAGLSRDARRPESRAGHRQRHARRRRRVGAAARPPPGDAVGRIRRIGRCTRAGFLLPGLLPRHSRQPRNEGDLAAPQRALARTLPAGGRLARQAVPGDRCDARGARRRRCRTLALAQSHRRRRALRRGAGRARLSAGRRRLARRSDRARRMARPGDRHRAAHARARPARRCCCWRFWRASCAGSTPRTSR